MKTSISIPAGILSILLCVLLLLPLQGAALEPETAAGRDSGMIDLLLIGEDDAADGVSRADSIILCTFHPETNRVILTSFLRDLYVQIPGHEGNRLNAAWALGGMPLLKKTLEESFRLEIDGCIAVDFSQFSRIIDILGGVTLELRQDEADAVNAVVPGTLTQGRQALSGSQALAYSRIRKLDSDGDFSRTLRQQKLLQSLLDSWKDAGLMKLLSAVAELIPLVATDLDNRQLLSIAVTLFPMIKDPQVSGCQIPEAGTFSYGTVRNMDVLLANTEEIISSLQRRLLPQAPRS